MRAVHAIDTPGSSLRALEAEVLSTHVEHGLLLAEHPDHFDALAWDPLIMKFTEYFVGGINARPSSLARGWGMPPLAKLTKVSDATGLTDSDGGLTTVR